MHIFFVLCMNKESAENETENERRLGHS
jgi:hypothetical protein